MFDLSCISTYHNYYSHEIHKAWYTASLPVPPPNDFLEHISTTGIEDDVNLKEREKYFKKGGSSVKAAVPARLLAKAGDGHFISGHLHRLYGDTWRKQWFVVREEMAGSGLYVMYTYKASEDASATNTDPLLGHGYSSNVDVKLTFLQ